MAFIEPSTDWIEFDAETDEVPFLHMHDMLEVKFDNEHVSTPVPAWSVDFDRSRDPVVAGGVQRSEGIFSPRGGYACI
jgi:hypothetical protein